jgi:hypothetical protein
LNRLSHGASSGASLAAITNLSVVGATLLDATNDFGDGTSRPGVNGNGWVGKVTVPFLVASTFDPTKISLTLSDPGFDAAGVTTVARTVRGGKILRRQYTPGGGQNSPMSSNDGTTLTVYFSLIGDGGQFATVYSGTTITAASAAVGYYGPATSGAISSLTNNSTRPYYKPGCVWLNRQHEVSGAGGQYVELVAMHKHGRGGQQVARVEFIATDAHANTAATQTASTPVISTLVTKGQPPEVYTATIPVTALTQADLCIVNAKIYPWIGDSSAILNLAVDGLNTTGTYATANPQTTLRFLNDKVGTWALGHASVKVGAVGGTVQTTEVASRATPFPTMDAALAALATYHNANAGHAGHDGGHMWLMDNGAGGAVAHVPNDLESPATDRLALTEIRKSPSNTANASVVLPAANVGVAWGLSWHVDIAQDAGGHFFRTFATNDSVVSYYCDGTYASVGSNPINYEQLTGVRNLTQTGSGPLLDVGGNSFTRIEVSAWIGYVALSAGGNCRVHAVVGCKLAGVAIAEFDPATLDLHDSQDGKIIVNNQFVSCSGASRVGDNYPMIRGLFVGQNVFEQAPLSVQQLLSIGDLGSDQPLDNVVVTGNTMVGNRFNLLYTDTSLQLKRAWTRFNLLYQRNTKADVYTTDSTAAGRNGNFAYINGVDNWDVCTFGDSNGAGIGVGNWIGEYWANPTMAQVGVANVTFTADNSSNGTGTGNGTYTLTGSTNAAYSTVPAGFAAFKFDMAGVARKNDGTGAAGAYERTV